jgi:anaerobic ribonucleoside-triphosphate reductase
MIPRVIKRDGRAVKFNPDKLKKGIKKAAAEVCVYLTRDELKSLIENISEHINKYAITNDITVEYIQDMVVDVLKKNGYKNISNAYSEYRKDRTTKREIKSDVMKGIIKVGVETDRDNANVGNNFSAKLLRIASISNKWQNLATMPKELSRAHENGDVYYHDLDSYNLTTNCLHIPTGKILSQGFNTGYGTINKPKRIESAAELSCILLQATQNDMFGGQSHVNFDNDLGEFVELTRQEIKEELESLFQLTHSEIFYHDPEYEKLVETKLRKTVAQAMQAIVYNLNTMHSRAGSQVPFSSVNIGIPLTPDAAMVCEEFLKAYEKGLGKGEQPIFPNIAFRIKDGVNKNPEDPYYYLYTLACRVASTRMNPTFMNMDSDFNLKYYEKGILAATMGCRTYVCSNINGQEGPDGRGNIAPVTINLPRVGILANKDINKFFKLLQERLEIGRDSLLHRYDVLKKLKVKDLPFVAGQGLMLGSEGLDPNDSIEPILKQGSWGIGFIGLAETLYALLGEHHGQSPEARELGVKIISFIRDYTDKITQEYKLNFSCYATPAEGLSGVFIKMDQKIFGVIPGVTDKDYYTNSYHVPVGFSIGIIDKLTIEAPYHKLCNAGHISYIEFDDYPDPINIEKTITWAYSNTNINYVGFNFHKRYCKDCGTDLHSNEQKCSNCGSTNIQGVSRVTGYLSLDERFGEGKTAERKDRQSHVSFNKNYRNV